MYTSSFKDWNGERQEGMKMDSGTSFGKRERERKKEKKRERRGKLPKQAWHQVRKKTKKERRKKERKKKGRTERKRKESQIET